MIYLIGSLRNRSVQRIANQLRDAGHDVFDDWQAAGPEADDFWQAYEMGRNRSYAETLEGIAARHVFDHDYKYLDACQTGVLVTPAGKSAHLELGWMLGRGKRGYILFDNAMPERYDVMYKLATAVCMNVGELLEQLA